MKGTRILRFPLFLPSELHHSGRAAPGVASRAGRVLHQPHDQIRRARSPPWRPGLHLLLQRPLRRERLINPAAAAAAAPLLLLPQLLLLLFGDLKPFCCPPTCFLLITVSSLNSELLLFLLLYPLHPSNQPRELVESREQKTLLKSSKICKKNTRLPRRDLF